METTLTSETFYISSFFQAVFLLKDCLKVCGPTIGRLFEIYCNALMGWGLLPGTPSEFQDFICLLICILQLKILVGNPTAHHDIICSYLHIDLKYCKEIPRNSMTSYFHICIFHSTILPFYLESDITQKMSNI